MTEPWNFTEAQRRQFREAHAEAKRKQMAEDTGFSEWPLTRLTEQRDHLQSILMVSAGQSDRPQIRAEYDALCAEIAKRTPETPRYRGGRVSKPNGGIVSRSQKALSHALRDEHDLVACEVAWLDVGQLDRLVWACHVLADVAQAERNGRAASPETTAPERS